MKRELDKRNEREIALKVRKDSCIARLGRLFGAGVSLGFVLFVAMTSCTLMNRGSSFAWASIRGMWQEPVKETHEISLPVLPSTLKAQPYRPQVSIMTQYPKVIVEKPVADYRMAQERRLLLSDLWSRLNQTLSTARSFAR